MDKKIVNILSNFGDAFERLVTTLSEKDSKPDSAPNKKFNSALSNIENKINLISEGIKGLKSSNKRIESKNDKILNLVKNIKEKKDNPDFLADKSPKTDGINELKESNKLLDGVELTCCNAKICNAEQS